jgi:Ca-activated chloride channel family protein
MKRSFLFVVLLRAACSWAQGFIFPNPGFQPPELVKHFLTAHMQDQAATVKVEQVFFNPTDRAMEGIYYFPIPREAILDQFDLYVDGKKLRGELLNREQARKVYEDIVRRDIDPALLEYADHRFFRISLFPIPARKERKIELSYHQVLSAADGLVCFRYAQHGDVQAGRPGRPIPMLPGRVEPPLRHNGEIKREIREPEPKACQQTFAVTVNASSAINNVYSPSHKIDVDRISDQEVRVRYEAARKTDEADFILYYGLSGNAMGLNLVCHRDGSGQGYFMLLAAPKTSWAEKEVIDKDVVFVLDTSGSMSGEKMEQAKSSLSYCINRLRAHDRFALVTFSSEVSVWRSEWSAAASAARDATAYVRTLEAKGGTNMDEALKRALQFKPRSGRTMQVVFMTDGLPTVGVQDIKTILEHVRQAAAPARIFAFGVGYDVNTYLLDKIAEQSRAVADYIAPQENIEEKISRFFDKVSKPVLTDLQLTVNSITVRDVYPKSLPDLFLGDQLLVVGRYEGSGQSAMVLQGRSGKDPVRFVYEANFAGREQNTFLPRLWASRKIAYLVDDMRTHGENEEVRKEIEALSKEFGILSPYTSFLAQEDEARPGPQTLGGVAMSNQLSQQLFRKSDASAPVASVGAGAVQVSKQLREMKEQQVLDSGQQARYVGDKAFYWQNDEWVESTWQKQPVLAVKHGSAAYVQLLLLDPGIGKYMTLGKKVVFSWNGKYIRIGDSGETDWTADKWRAFFASK